MKNILPLLVEAIHDCRICADHFEHDPRPIVQLHHRASVLIVGQAPGSRAHASGIPFDDASGDRLRDWMGISRETFYDPHKIAILPMGFCFPGTGTNGDLPPRKECASAWRQQVLDALPNIRTTLVMGQYASAWHLGKTGRCNLTNTVKAWKSCAPAVIPLPHPSPRNNLWLKKNPWFATEVLPALRSTIHNTLG